MTPSAEPASPELTQTDPGIQRGGRGRSGPGGESPRRREQIIRAAKVVLGRQGYPCSSLKEIAREAGVAPGLLHYYFTSKEELLLEVVMALELEMKSDWREVISHYDDPLERIVAGLDRAAQLSIERPEFMRLLFDLYVLGHSNEVVRVRMQELRQRRVAVIESELRAILGPLQAYAVVQPNPLAQAIAGAIDGIALGDSIDRSDATGAYQALKVMLMSLVVTAHVVAGQQPPIARLQELLGRPAPRTPEPGR